MSFGSVWRLAFCCRYVVMSCGLSDTPQNVGEEKCVFCIGVSSIVYTRFICIWFSCLLLFWNGTLLELECLAVEEGTTHAFQTISIDFA